MKTPAVSVVIVTYNSADDIGACLDAVLAHDEVAGAPLEVIVVDNASSDGTADIVLERAHAVTLVELPENLGFAVGVNLAVSHAHAAEILLLNPDCVIERDCVTVLHDVLARDPQAGAVGALLTYPDGKPQLFARRDTTPRLAFWSFTELGRHLDERWRDSRWRSYRRYEQRWPPTTRTEYDAIAGACVLVRRPATGPLLDEDLVLFFNDTDLYLRLRDEGKTVTVEPSAHATHAYGATFRALPIARYNAEMLAALGTFAGKRWPRRWRIAWIALQLVDVLGCLVLLTRPRARVIARNDLAALAGAWGLPGGAPPLLARPRLRRRR